MSDSRSRIWFALFVLAVFCVGLAAGAIVGRRYGGPARAFDGPGFGGPAGRGPGAGRPSSAGRLIDRLDRGIELTGDQRIAIQKIFEARRERLEAVQRDMRGRMDQEQRELQAEIRKVLTPEQLPKFEKWLEEDRTRGRGRRGGSSRPER